MISIVKEDMCVFMTHSNINVLNEKRTKRIRFRVGEITEYFRIKNPDDFTLLLYMQGIHEFIENHKDGMTFTSAETIHDAGIDRIKKSNERAGLYDVEI